MKMKSKGAALPTIEGLQGVDGAADAQVYAIEKAGAFRRLARATSA